MISQDTQAVVLAAGRSRRFKTGKTKQLADICGQPMIFYSLKVLDSLHVPIVLVVGTQSEDIHSEVDASGIKNLEYAIQEKQLGTGSAVASARSHLDHDNVLIMNGDSPLLTTDLIKDLYRSHEQNKNDITFFATNVLDPEGYGRVETKAGNVHIIEHKECTEEQLHINTINAGVYLVKRSFLLESLDTLKQSETTGEFYITDMVNYASDSGRKAQALIVPYDNVRGVNTLEDLWAVEQIKRSEFIKHWMSQGVRFELAQNIHLDYDIEIGAGSYIGSGVHLLKGTKIGKNCTVQAFSIVEKSIVQDNSTISYHSVIQESTIGKGCSVGPFARFRNNVTLEDKATVGNFVEVKNSTLGTGSKAKHLAYLGDATLGTKVNIGAGTITCNHDGAHKHKTNIESEAYIGSNSTLVAPVRIEKGAYTAAGSTITKDVPADALAVGRARQVNKEGYAKKLRSRNKREGKNRPKKTEAKKTSTGVEFIGAVKTGSLGEDSAL